MTRFARALLSAVLATAAAVALTACVGGASPRQTVLPAPLSPSPAPTVSGTPERTPTNTLPSASPIDGASQDCGGVAVTVSGSGLDAELSGDCPSVTVSGTGITVDVSAAEVDALEVNGDRNSVTGAALGSISIGGQENVVDAQSLGSIAVNGDRNTIDAVQTIGSGVVSGNDNIVSAATVGDVTDSGQRNTIGVR